MFIALTEFTQPFCAGGCTPTPWYLLPTFQFLLALLIVVVVLAAIYLYSRRRRKK